MEFTTVERAAVVLERLVAHQANEELHPLTCGKCTDRNGQATELRPRIADRTVWLECPMCDFVQWAISPVFRHNLPPSTHLDQQYRQAPM